MQCVRNELLFQGYYCGSFTFPAAVANGTLPPWWYDRRQELMTASPSKQSPKFAKIKHSQRGSEGKINADCENSSSAANPSWNSKKSDSNSPRNPRKMDNASAVNESDETEKENWMKSGQEKGFYRPRMRKKQKKKDDESFVWSVPP